MRAMASELYDRTITSVRDAMMKECKFSMKIPKTGEETIILCSFDDSEWDYLEKFLQYANELSQVKFVRSGMQCSFKLKGERGKGVQALVQLPPWDDVTVFLHKLRPLSLQSEPTNFLKVRNILSKNLENPHIRQFLLKERDRFSGKLMQGEITFKSNDIIINSEKVLADWLNSHEYHRDKEKKEFVDSLHKVFPLDISKFFFICLLTDKTQAIFKMAGLVKAILCKTKNWEESNR